MIYITSIGTGFGFGIGLFVASVLVKALFHSGICG